jgi:hypothetical protein
MQKVSARELMRKAGEMAKLAKSWHYHELSPGCRFNDRKLNALVLENETDRQCFVSYSEERPLEEGKMLVRLLHGETILEVKAGASPPSKEMQDILERARALNGKQKPWEHHLLFPECIFNTHKGGWVLVFEGDETIESITREKPSAGLDELERLFYAQKK